jgi:hypothetical protein
VRVREADVCGRIDYVLYNTAIIRWKLQASAQSSPSGNGNPAVCAMDHILVAACQPSTLKYKSTPITASHLYAVLYTKCKEDYGIAAHLIMELVCWLITILLLPSTRFIYSKLSPSRTLLTKIVTRINYMLSLIFRSCPALSYMIVNTHFEKWGLEFYFLTLLFNNFYVLRDYALITRSSTSNHFSFLFSEIQINEV